MLGTDGISSVPNAFGLATRNVIEDLWEKFPVLYNYVDVRNKASIKWLQFHGAVFSDPAPYGPGKLPFRYFQLKKAA